ncbi:MAG: hypothetical protein KBG15_22245 [Kofleriaceae bacterium]|nr:hypothetical protein [Kofleriaceae bacterium]
MRAISNLRRMWLLGVIWVALLLTGAPSAARAEWINPSPPTMTATPPSQAHTAATRPATLPATSSSVSHGAPTVAAAGSERRIEWPADSEVSMSGLPFASRHGAIIVFAEPGLRRRAIELASQADRYLAQIAEDLPGLPQPALIEVRFVDDASHLNRVAPQGRGAPAYAIGVAYPDLGIISVAMRRGGTYSNPTETLRHELAHLALGAALGPDVPRWLHEGFAYQHSAEWSWARTETLAGMAWGGTIVGLEELEAGFPSQELPASHAYAQSYDFVGYLSRRGRWDDKSDDGDRWAFRRFLIHVANSHDLDAAAIHAFGRPMHELFDEWRTDLRTRYMLIPAGVFASLLWIIGALLLTIGWYRRRRQNHRRIAMWDQEERGADVARQQEAARQATLREAWLSLAVVDGQTSSLVTPPASSVDAGVGGAVERADIGGAPDVSRDESNTN